jgi:hypothetical protein
MAPFDLATYWRDRTERSRRFEARVLYFARKHDNRCEASGDMSDACECALRAREVRALDADPASAQAVRDEPPAGADDWPSGRTWPSID